MGQKRKRLALSCVACRKRKVKCDRTEPSCVRCQKGGIADECAYVAYPGGDTTGLPTPQDDRPPADQDYGSWDEEVGIYEKTAHQIGTTLRVRSEHEANVVDPVAKRPRNLNAEQKLDQLHGRLMDIETMVWAAGGKPTSNEVHLGLLNPIGPGGSRGRNPWADNWKLTDHEKVLLRGKSFKTQYSGPSNTVSILLQFEELATFIRDILRMLPNMQSTKKTLVKIRAKEKESARQQHDLSIDYLISLVPPKARADLLFHSYLDTIETSYRVLHVPTFTHQYEQFWISPQEAKKEFIVQLLIAFACVAAFVPGGEVGYVGRSSAARETATHWINVGAYWLDNQSKKHVSLINYQLPIQLWIARAINTIKVKQIWVDSGAIVRRFMAAGLHREPSLLSSKINAFDCEMRRRLWYTALELDLDETVNRGMTPTIGPMDWDTQPPLNIDDESFNEDTETMPPPKPRGKFTRTSFLSWSAETLPFRIELLYKINSIRCELDLETVLSYDHKLRQLGDKIPLAGWTDHAKHHTITTYLNPSPLVAITLSQAILSEYIVFLHQPFSTDPQFKNEHFQSRVARRYACIKSILLYNPKLSIHDATSQSSLPHYLHLNDIQRRFFEFSRNDFVRAALALSHSYAISASPSSHPFMLHPGPDNHIVTYVQTVVDMLDDRVRLLGQGFHGYWICSSSLSFVHSKGNKDVPRETFTKAAADRVAALHAALMDGQLPKAKAMLEHGDSSPSASPGQEPVQEVPDLGVQSFERVQDMAVDFDYGFENMDWNMLLNTDPMNYMEALGPWDYPS